MTSLDILQGHVFQEDLVSEESAQVVRPILSLLGIGREMGVSTSMTETEAAWSNVLVKRFDALATTWRRQCAHLSSVREMVLHPAYQQIVGMGAEALPGILAELERKPDHWFWALRAITREDPVPLEHRGNVALMARDWLQWAKRKGLCS